MKIPQLLLIIVLAAGCSDTVTTRYETRADAEAGRLFDRGWLPWIIPQSTDRIVTRNNQDLNTSSGEFSFAPEEHASFISRLRKIDEQSVPENQEQIRCWKKGYDPYSYIRYNSEWTFYIHPAKGHCHYWMEHIDITRSSGTSTSASNAPDIETHFQPLETLKALETE